MPSRETASLDLPVPPPAPFALSKTHSSTISARINPLLPASLALLTVSFPSISWILYTHSTKWLIFTTGTKGKGVANIGKLNSALINGSLVIVPMINDAYIVRGDVYLDNKLVAPNQTFIMDEGTDNIQGYGSCDILCTNDII